MSIMQKIGGRHHGKRRLLTSIVAIAAGLALASCGVNGTNTPDPSNTAGGGELTILVEAGGHGQLQPIADKFTQETGTKVTFVELPYDGLYDRLSSELSSGKVSFDIAAMDAIWLTAFKDGVISLDDLFTAGVKSDIFPALLSEAQANGHFIGMPAWTNAQLLFYRTDLFNDPDQQAGFKSAHGYDLAAPTTWQQYLDIAAFFTQDTNNDGKYDIYGADVKGKVETEWLATVLQAGSKSVVLDANNNVIINDAAHKLALDHYIQLVQDDLAPAGASQLDWGAAQNLFNQGQLAMTQFWAHAYTQIPTDSPVYGKVGVVPMPAGPGGIAGIPGAWYLSIPTAGTQQDLAKQFISFSFTNNALGLGTSLGLAATKSALESMQNQPGHENLKPLIETLDAAGTAPRPANAKWQEITDSVLIPMLQKAVVKGADTQRLLDDAKTQIEGIIG